MCIFVCLVNVVFVVFFGGIIRMCLVLVVVIVVGSVFVIGCSLLVRLSLFRNLYCSSDCGLIWLLVVRMFRVMVRL